MGILAVDIRSEASMGVGMDLRRTCLSNLLFAGGRVLVVVVSVRGHRFRKLVGEGSWGDRIFVPWLLLVALFA